MNVEIQYDLNRLADTMRRYAVVSGKTEDEALAKQSAKLGWNVSKGLRALAPKKGAVRADRIEALRSGIGVKVRPGVLAEIGRKYGGGSVERKGKTMNFWALAAQREIAVRESARGFSAWSAPRPSSQNPEPTSMTRELRSRYGYGLSDFSLSVGRVEVKHALLRWTEKVEGIGTPHQQQVIAGAIRTTITDIQAYIERKQLEDIERFFTP
jgi:hypothetical protein